MTATRRNLDTPRARRASAALDASYAWHNLGMTRRTLAPCLTLGLALILAGCGSDAKGETTVTTEPTKAEAFTTSDVTDELRAANAGAPWVQSVVIATQTEPERVVVETTIVDPRGDDGSDEARTAIQVCEATVTLLEGMGAGAPKVSIMEDDGTSFVLYGHPSYPGGCTEV